jgi:hypothetical protein
MRWAPEGMRQYQSSRRLFVGGNTLRPGRKCVNYFDYENDVL